MLDKGTGNKTWKERGVGEVKFLKHNDHGRIRVLMRQEKTMKVIINHFLDPRIVLRPNVSSDKSWVWVAFDYSEGKLEETVSLSAWTNFTMCSMLIEDTFFCRLLLLDSLLLRLPRSSTRSSPRARRK